MKPRPGARADAAIFSDLSAIESRDPSNSTDFSQL
jgi:hypothetical protein